MATTSVLYDEITGLPYDPATTKPAWVVTLGFLAFSTHNSEAAARAWVRWNMTPEQRQHAHIERM